MASIASFAFTTGMGQDNPLQSNVSSTAIVVMAYPFLSWSIT
jgi:hypothetical protein